MIKIVIFFITLFFASLGTTFVYHKAKQSDINYYKGHHYLEKREYEQAAAFYEKSLDIEPGRLDALRDLAYNYQWSGRYKEAIEVFQEILSLKPDDYRIKESLAETFSWVKEYSKSIALYKEVIATTQNDKVRIKLVEVYLWNDQPNEARVVLKGLLKNNPKDPRSRLLLARALAYLGESKESARLFEELLNEITAGEGDATRELEIRLLLGEVYITSRDYKKAKDLFVGIIDEHPRDIRAFLYLGEVYLFSGDYKAAKDIFTGLLKIYPGNIEVKVYLADTFAYNKEFQEAIALYKEILSQNPGPNLEIKRKLADVLSWCREYDVALIIFDEILAQKENKKIRLQKARVLGWQCRYAESLQEYQRILDNGYDADIDLEMKAKMAYWDNRPRQAIAEYRELIKNDPKNAEAMFDLSQVYSYQSMWKEAIAGYESIINSMPTHFRAKEGVKKAKLIAAHPSLKTGYEFYEADSSARMDDIRRYSFFNKFVYPIDYNLSLNLDYRLTNRLFSDFGDVLENEGRFKLVYLKNPGWWMDMFYDLIVYNKDIHPMNTFGVSHAFRFFDKNISRFSYERERLENNSTVIRGHYYSDNFKERLDIDINKRTKLGLDYLFANYSDGNNKQEPGIDLLYYLSFEPKRLTLKYRYFYKNFLNKVSEYFSPKGFSTNSIKINWRHFLNKEEIFFGADDLYYDLAYEISADSTGIVSNKFSAEFNWDINKRLNLNIKGSDTESSANIYRDRNIMASVNYYF